jgi:hypothetical protein
MYIRSPANLQKIVKKTNNMKIIYIMSLTYIVSLYFQVCKQIEEKTCKTIDKEILLLMKFPKERLSYGTWKYESIAIF